MGCKLQQSITKKNCNYDVAGIAELYLINFERGEKIDIAAITADVYEVDFLDNTASFTDELAEGGNGSKYRTHTLNFSIDSASYEALNDDKKALSLSKFVAVIVDKNNKAFMLGRNNGLSATSFNYESGAADADGKGWTVVMAGTEIESAPLLSDIALVDLRALAAASAGIIG